MNTMTEWRKSTTQEIRAYYHSEFPTYLNQLPDHITAVGPYEYAVSLRSKHPLVGGGLDTDFVRRATHERLKDNQSADWGDPVFLDSTGNPSFDSVLDFIQAPATRDPRHNHQPENALVNASEENLDEPIPEAVYYRLMNHDVGWVLMFDIDAKDVAADAYSDQFDDDTGRETILEESGVYDEEPEGYAYRFEDIEQAIQYAFDLADFAREGLGKEKVLPVYSGQGAHLYVLDETVRQYTRQTREGLKNAVLYGEDLGIPIDPVVTQTPDRLARLPYSLHSEVSRICMPIPSPDFDFREEAVPQFLDD